MTQEEVYQVFKEAGVLQEGHFILTSGRHSNKYMQCAKLFQYTKYAEPLCRELALKFKDQQVDAVVGPALGAIQMSYEVSRHLGVKNMFTERVDGVMTMRRGFEIKEGERILVVEDVVTTGGSVKEVLKIVKEKGGIPVGVGCIVDRSAGKVDFGVPLSSVVSVEIESYDPAECPLCKEGKTPAVKPGSSGKK